MYERDEQDLSNIIEESLEEIRSGKSSLEDVLKAHPHLAHVLRPELEAALWLSASQAQVAARPGFVTSSRKRIVERVRMESVGMGRKRGLFGIVWPSLGWRPVSAMAAVLVLVVAVWSLLAVAQGAVPGHSLYAVKRIHEQVQFGVALSETRRVELTTKFSEQRLNEIETLLEQGNPEAATVLLDDFQMEVVRTVRLLNAVDDTQLAEKREAAQSVQLELEKQAQQLEELQAEAPIEVRAEIAQARALALQSALIAVSVEDAVDRKTATPVPTTVVPSATHTATRTATPTATNTPTDPAPVFGETPAPPPEQVPSLTPGNGSGKDPKPSHTPKPTNENRPTERPPKDTATPKPPKDGVQPTDASPAAPPTEVLPTSAPPTETQPTDVPPGDKEKPPKDEKPTKAPNPTNAAGPPDEKKPTKTPKP